MMVDPYRKKRIRLPEAAYGTSGTVWLVTIGTDDRPRRHFADDAFASTVADLLIAVCDRHGATLIVGCVMPDHVHAVMEVTTGNLIAVVRSFKSLVVRRWWESGHGGTLWQKSFHDRGLRTREDIEAGVTYVFENPARAGLVDNAEDYPYLRGSAVGHE